ncbi:MAG: Zinc-type alcohol dehydrogenase-like protein [Chlamydiae bacterium]|nr:Zinc-type alcohol dehydrogenase-like protein [Chlamydiota bacterium]
MKAIIIDEPGGADLFQERDLPIPKPGRGDVRVKLKASGFNPVDYKIRKGMYEGGFPLVLGADFSGVVDGAGDLVRDFSEGDEVFGMAFGPCSNGSYAEYLCVPAQFLAKKPPNLSFEKAAGVAITYLTAFQALVSKGALQKDRPLFLTGGSGGVGSAAIALTKVYGAGPVFTMAGSEESANFLIKYFAIPSDHILRYQGLTLKTMAHKLLEMNKGERFYFALDFVGDKAKELCLEVVDFFGHIATVLPESDDFPIPVWGRSPGPIWSKSLSLHMIFVGAAAIGGDEKSWTTYKSQLGHIAKLFEKKNLMPPQTEILGELSIQTVQQAHQRLEEGHTKGKLIMKIS